MSHQEVPWRFGERATTYDFLQVENVAVREEACNMLAPGGDLNRHFESLAKWIRDGFEYPLNSSGQPCAEGVFRYGRQTVCGWHYEKAVNYMWLYPNEVLSFRHGICIDTANLAVTVGICLGLKALVILGEVRSAKDDQVLGYHAWYQSPYLDEPYVIETTVHEPGSNNIVSTKDAYDKNSAWAQTRGLYYFVQARYNRDGYQELGPLGAKLPLLLGLPAKHAMVYGIQHTMEHREKNPRMLARAWRLEEGYLVGLIKEAYKTL